MGGKGCVQWSKLWNMAWWPGLKETRGPVAFTVLLLLSAYFFLELYLFLVVDSSPPGVILPITTNTSGSPCYASPYCVITSKSLFLAPMDFYLHKPTAIVLNKVLNLSSFLSANFVSVSHILLSIFSARLIAQDSLCVRRLGVILFELRNLFDSLDGVIARDVSKRNEALQSPPSTVTETLHSPSIELNRKQIIDVFHTGSSHWDAPMTINGASDIVTTSQGGITFGYFIDGICDGIGCIFLMVACLIYLQRHPHRKSQVAYSPLALVTVNGSRNGSNSTNGSSNNSKTHNARFETSSHSKIYTRKEKDDVDVAPNLSPKSSLFFGVSLTSIMNDIWTGVATVRSGLSCGAGLPAVLFLFQLLLSSMFWNRDILIYARILEGSPADRNKDIVFKSSVIHSTMLWLVIFSWRIINPLNMTEALLLAIFFDKMADLLQFFQYLGFLIISCVAALSEMHHYDLVKYRE